MIKVLLGCLYWNRSLGCVNRMVYWIHPCECEALEDRIVDSIMY